MPYIQSAIAHFACGPTCSNGLHFVFRSEIMLFSTNVCVYGSCKGHTKLRFPLLSGKFTVKSMVHWFFSNENLMPEDAPRSNAS